MTGQKPPPSLSTPHATEFVKATQLWSNSAPGEWHYPTVVDKNKRDILDQIFPP